MERQDCEIRILPSSRLFQFLSAIVFHLVFVLQTAVYPLLFGFRVRGREHLRGISHAVFVSNHCHYLDPGFVAASVWPHKVYFTGMEETFRIRGFSAFIRLLRSFPIPAENPGKIIRPIARLFRDSRPCSIHLFPEGELAHHTQSLRSFKNGAFSLARFFDVPIIPIVEIQKSRRLLPPKITMIIEAPVYMSSFTATGSRAARFEAASDFIFSVMEKRLQLYHG